MIIETLEQEGQGVGPRSSEGCRRLGRPQVLQKKCFKHIKHKKTHHYQFKESSKNHLKNKKNRTSPLRMHFLAPSNLHLPPHLPPPTKPTRGRWVALTWHGYMRLDLHKAPDSAGQWRGVGGGLLVVGCFFERLPGFFLGDVCLQKGKKPPENQNILFF